MQKPKYLKKAGLLCLLLSLLGTINARTRVPSWQNYNDKVYQAYISDRMVEWDHVIKSLNGRKTSLSDKELGSLVNYYYGYTGWAISNGQKKKAARYIEEADAIIDQLQAKQPDAPEWYAYKAAFIAYRISINKMRAAFLAKESNKNIDRAIELGPECSQAWIEKGNGMFYTPKILGGSKGEARQAYEKAIRIMERNPGSIQNNWLYLNVLMMLGQSYDKTGNPRLARFTYEKILEIEPNFTYVRDELYPAFLKAQNP